MYNFSLEMRHIYKIANVSAVRNIGLIVRLIFVLRMRSGI